MLSKSPSQDLCWDLLQNHTMMCDSLSVCRCALLLLPLGWRPPADATKGHLGVLYNTDDRMAQPRMYASATHPAHELVCGCTEMFRKDPARAA